MERGVGWRPATRDDRVAALTWAAAAIALSLPAPLYPVLARFTPSCTFRVWTGLACPTCGSTRVAVSLARADIADALAVNPLATIVAVAFLAGGLLAPVWVWGVGRIPVRRAPRARTVVLVALAILLANWIYLVMRGT